MQSVTLREGMGNRPELRAPDWIGRYEIIQKLATGGMAELFLARFAGPGGFEKRCALKRILPQFAADETFRRMFLNEARVTAMFDHPNLVQIFELGEDDAGQFYIAMELVQGLNVRQIISLAHSRKTPIPPEIATFMAIQALDGLAYAHDFVHPDTGEPLGLVHRDISPQNILVSSSGAVKLVDFGIVKGASISGETQAGMLKGKVTYMSPEQAAGEPLDRRTDLFSLGICLFEMVAGVRPFGGKNELMVLKAILEKAPLNLIDHAPSCPEGVEQAILRSLTKDREDRFTDARAFQMALQEVLQKTPKPVTRHTLADYLKSIEADAKTFDAAQIRIPRQHSPTPSQTSFRPPAPQATTPNSGSHPGAPPHALRDGPLAFRPSASASRLSQFAENLTPQPVYEDAAGLSDVARAAGVSPQRPYATMVVLFCLSALVGAGAVWSIFYLQTGNAVVVEPVPEQRRSGFPAGGSVTPEPPVRAVPAAPPPLAEPKVEKTPPALPNADEEVPTPSPPTESESRASARRESTRSTDRSARSARGTLDLKTTPSDLTVMRGKRRLGVTPLEIRMPVGRHSLRLVGTDRGIHRKITVEIGRDAVTEERVVIEKGTLRIVSRPWAEVYLDGIHHGKTPIVIEAYAGPHTLRLVSPEGGEHTERVTVRGGKATPVLIKF